MRSFQGPFQSKAFHDSMINSPSRAAPAVSLLLIHHDQENFLLQTPSGMERENPCIEPDFRAELMAGQTHLLPPGSFIQTVL